jgi:hypothetical protein
MGASEAWASGRYFGDASHFTLNNGHTVWEACLYGSCSERFIRPTHADVTSLHTATYLDYVVTDVSRGAARA